MLPHYLLPSAGLLSSGGIADFSFACGDFFLADWRYLFWRVGFNLTLRLHVFSAVCRNVVRKTRKKSIFTPPISLYECREVATHLHLDALSIPEDLF